MKSYELESNLKNMETWELHRVLIREKENYYEETLGEIEKELRSRGVTLADATNQIEVKVNDEPKEAATVTDALAWLRPDMPVWDSVHFSNGLKEHLAIQKAHDFWLVHHAEPDGSGGTFGMETFERIREMVELFLRLEVWEPEEDAVYNLDDWATFATSDSLFWIKNLAAVLENADIPYLLQDMNLWHFNAIFGTQSISEPYVLLVPGEEIEACDEVLRDMLKKAVELRSDLERAEAAHDLEALLKIYEELERIVREDASFFYNKGTVLLDLERFEEAADAFIQSAEIDMKSGMTESAYETERTLKEILTKIPENTAILHGLAHIARTRNDSHEVIELYRRIIAIDEDDSMAHLSLGNLYYESDSDQETYRHFKRYLELEPNAGEKEEIEAILAELEYSR